MRINKQIQAWLGHPKATIELAATSLHGFQDDANPKVVVAMPDSFADFAHALLHSYVKYFQVLTGHEFIIMLSILELIMILKISKFMIMLSILELIMILKINPKGRFLLFLVRFQSKPKLVY